MRAKYITVSIARIESVGTVQVDSQAALVRLDIFATMDDACDRFSFASRAQSHRLLREP